MNERQTPDRVLQLPSGPFPLDRVRLMGILNVTPDSFYDGGRYNRLDAAVARAEALVEEGADIIDVGGERAGPGERVSVDDEICRVTPAIEAIRARFDVPVAVDTFKPAVARAAVNAGAEIINSIGGFLDADMRRVASETGAAVVIMHIQGAPRVHQPHPQYEDVVDDVRSFLREQSSACEVDGIGHDRIVVDPGPDFGKTTEHSLAVIRSLDFFTAMPYPVLLAVSRKRFIGETLNLPVDERLEGGLALTAWGVLHGIRIVRAHDIRETWRVVRMTEAVLYPESVEARS